MPYRMLLADLDGTVLNSQGDVTPETVSILHRAREVGWRVILATGRSYRTALPVARRIGLGEPIICAGGALVKDPVGDRTLAAHCMPRELVRRVLHAVHGAGQSACVHRDAPPGQGDRVLAAGPGISAELRQYLDAFGNDHQTCGPGDSRPQLGGCLEVSVWAADDALRRCRRAVEAALDSQVRTLIIYAPNAALRVLEIFAPGVSKWAAARVLADGLGIAADEIVAVGDDINDVEMVQGAGLGIAMGNAADELRRAAERVAPSNDENGLAAAVEALL